MIFLKHNFGKILRVIYKDKNVDFLSSRYF